MGALFGLDGGSFAEHVLVWRKHFGYYDEAIDCDGNKIKFAEYGKYSECGWQIDHHIPTVLGGGDGLPNKRPHHWRGNSLAGAIIGNALRRGLF